MDSYQSAMNVLQQKGYIEPLRKYLADHKRPYLGICLGMQTLLESSEEAPEGEEKMPGLGIIPGPVVKFDDKQMTVLILDGMAALIIKIVPCLSMLMNRRIYTLSIRIMLQ